MKELLLQHIASHPATEPQDVIKFCYQAFFGAEHLLTDKNRAYDYFSSEWENTPPTDQPLWEPLSDHYGRVHIGAWKASRLPMEWLFRMFYQTASVNSGITNSTLQQAFAHIATLAQNNVLPFSLDAWQSTLDAYQAAGGGAIHHSDRYRAEEHPAYRVVDRRYIDLIPLLEHISHISVSQKVPTIIAIDGRAASGKSTLSDRLVQILDAGLIHMDDFFLPAELRTPDRLAEAGGNVHYERFKEEILPHLKHNESFIYSTFDCKKMQLGTKTTVKSSNIHIVEGSYAHHPKFGSYMDFRVFCHVSPQEQIRRIIKRNGEQMAAMFVERWIPMEEYYFYTFRTQEESDFIYTTE